MDPYALIKRFEGLRLEAYRDVVGIPTIGYGHTKGVKMGDVCTEEQADKWLEEDAEEASRAIKRCVKVPLNENQYSALLSFTYNVGAGALERSTLLTLLNEKHYESAGDQLMNWVYAGGRKIQGLINRRKAEQELWNIKPGE